MSRPTVGLACSNSVRQRYIAAADLARLTEFAEFRFRPFELRSGLLAPPPYDADAEREIAEFARGLDALLVCHGAPRITADLLTPALRLIGELEGDRFGYRIDVARLGIFSPQLLDQIIRADGSPLLRSGFESSVPKLHFVGSYAVRSFGPLLRFIAGAPYAARAVAQAAHEGASQQPAGSAQRERVFGAVATPTGAVSAVGGRRSRFTELLKSGTACADAGGSALGLVGLCPPCVTDRSGAPTR